MLFLFESITPATIPMFCFTLSKFWAMVYLLPWIASEFYTMLKMRFSRTSGLVVLEMPLTISAEF